MAHSHFDLLIKLVKNLLSIKLARERTGRLSALGVFYVDLLGLVRRCQVLKLIYSHYVRP